MLQQGRRMESAGDFGVAAAAFPPSVMSSLCLPSQYHHHHHHLAPESSPSSYRPFHSGGAGSASVSTDLSGLFPPFSSAGSKLSIKSHPALVTNSEMAKSGKLLVHPSALTSSSPPPLPPSPHHFNPKEVMGTVGQQHPPSSVVLPSGTPPWFLAQPSGNNSKKRRQLSESGSGTWNVPHFLLGTPVEFLWLFFSSVNEWNLFILLNHCGAVELTIIFAPSFRTHANFGKCGKACRFDLPGRLSVPLFTEVVIFGLIPLLYLFFL